MDYFAGLDISMDETYVCVLDREGAVVRESKAASTAEAIADELSRAGRPTRRSSRSPPTRPIATMLVVWRTSPELGSSSLCM